MNIEFLMNMKYATLSVCVTTLLLARGVKRKDKSVKKFTLLNSYNMLVTYLYMSHLKQELWIIYG